MNSAAESMSLVPTLVQAGAFIPAVALKKKFKEFNKEEELEPSRGSPPPLPAAAATKAAR